jgi:AGZA family xanthine/uracil permease-like MFS transporter
MMTGVREIAWNDLTEAIPAFLTMVMMPLTVSITEGIAFGFIAYAALKLCTGRAREAHALVYGCAGLFVARYIWLI